VQKLEGMEGEEMGDLQAGHSICLTDAGRHLVESR
jgi:hypothetical protein